MNRNDAATVALSAGEMAALNVESMISVSCRGRIPDRPVLASFIESRSGDCEAIADKCLHAALAEEGGLTLTYDRWRVSAALLENSNSREAQGALRKIYGCFKEADPQMKANAKKLAEYFAAAEESAFRTKMKKQKEREAR